VSAPDPLPERVEFHMDMHDSRDFMERLHDISQQLGYRLPEALLDRGLDLPKAVRLRCALDTREGVTWVLGVDVVERS